MRLDKPPKHLSYLRSTPPVPALGGESHSQAKERLVCQEELKNRLSCEDSSGKQAEALRLPDLMQEALCPQRCGARDAPGRPPRPE